MATRAAPSGGYGGRLLTANAKAVQHVGRILDGAVSGRKTVDQVVNEVGRYFDPRRAFRRNADGDRYAPQSGFKREGESNASYAARRLMATETSARHGAAAVERARKRGHLVQWRLSPSHPKQDVCDPLAGTDWFGLGRGVFPPDDTPKYPAHPWCRCILVWIDPKGEVRDRYRAIQRGDIVTTPPPPRELTETAMPLPNSAMPAAAIKLPPGATTDPEIPAGRIKAKTAADVAKKLRQAEEKGLTLKQVDDLYTEFGTVRGLPELDEVRAANAEWWALTRTFPQATAAITRINSVDPETMAAEHWQVFGGTADIPFYYDPATKILHINQMWSAASADIPTDYKTTVANWFADGKLGSGPRDARAVVRAGFFTALGDYLNDQNTTYYLPVDSGSQPTWVAAVFGMLSREDRVRRASPVDAPILKERFGHAAAAAYEFMLTGTVPEGADPEAVGQVANYLRFLASNPKTYDAAYVTTVSGPTAPVTTDPAIQKALDRFEKEVRDGTFFAKSGMVYDLSTALGAPTTRGEFDASFYEDAKKLMDSLPSTREGLRPILAANYPNTDFAKIEPLKDREWVEVAKAMIAFADDFPVIAAALNRVYLYDESVYPSWAYMGRGYMGLSRQQFLDNPDKFREDKKRSAETGWHNKYADTIAATIFHELGHHLDNWLLDHSGNPFPATGNNEFNVHGVFDLWAVARNYREALFAYSTRFPKFMSEYGRTRDVESWASAIQQVYTTPPDEYNPAQASMSRFLSFLRKHIPIFRYDASANYAGSLPREAREAMSAAAQQWHKEVGRVDTADPSSMVTRNFFYGTTPPVVITPFAKESTGTVPKFDPSLTGPGFYAAPGEADPVGVQALVGPPTETPMALPEPTPVTEAEARVALNAQVEGYKQALDARHVNALGLYWGFGSKGINRAISGDPAERDDNAATIAALDALFEITRAPVDLTVYRGSSTEDATRLSAWTRQIADAKPGDTVTVPSIWSTTMTKDVAANWFGGGVKGATFKYTIKVPAGTPAVWTQGIRDYMKDSANEDELTLRRGLTYRVDKVTRTGDERLSEYDVELTVVAAPPVEPIPVPRRPGDPDPARPMPSVSGALPVPDVEVRPTEKWKGRITQEYTVNGVPLEVTLTQLNRGSFLGSDYRRYEVKAGNYGLMVFVRETQPGTPPNITTTPYMGDDPYASNADEVEVAMIGDYPQGAPTLDEALASFVAALVERPDWERPGVQALEAPPAGFAGDPDADYRDLIDRLPDDWKAAHKAAMSARNADGMRRDESLNYYTGQGFGRINPALRQDAGEAVAKPTTDDERRWVQTYIDDIDAIFADTPPLPQDIVVWRGVETGRYENVQVGDEIVYPAYMSTSLSPTLAESFQGGAMQSKRPQNVMLKILVPAGAKAIPVELYGRRGEQEVLLPRDTRFRVLDWQMPDPTNPMSVQITLEVIPEPEVQALEAPPPPAFEGDPDQFIAIPWYEAIRKWSGKLKRFIEQNDMKTALREYAGDGYLMINGLLRDPDVPTVWKWTDKKLATVREWTRRIDGAMSYAALPEEAVLWRGLVTDKWRDKQVGDRVNFPAYISTSTDDSVAKSFQFRGRKAQGDDEHVLLRILAPKGTRAIPFNMIGLKSTLEAEVLLDRGYDLRVVSIERENRTFPSGRTYPVADITVEVVDPEAEVQALEAPPPAGPSDAEVAEAAAWRDGRMAVLDLVNADIDLRFKYVQWLLRKNGGTLDAERVGYLDEFIAKDSESFTYGPNEYTSAEKLGILGRIVATIDDALFDTPALTNPVSLWRVGDASEFAGLAPGDTFVDPAYLTAGTSAAISLGKSKTAVRVEVRAVPGTPALPLGEYAFANEGSYLLDRGLTYRVVEIRRTPSGAIDTVVVETDPGVPPQRVEVPEPGPRLPKQETVVRPPDPAPDQFSGMVTGTDYWDGLPQAHKDINDTDWRLGHAALNAYAGDSFNAINRFLRGDAKDMEISDQYGKRFQVSDAAFALSRIAERVATYAPTVVYRGIRRTNSYRDLKVGDTFANPAFTSTSLVESIADQFVEKGQVGARDGENVKLHIRVPAGTPAIPKPNNKSMDPEWELILDKGTNFKVTDIKKSANGYLTNIYVDVVPAPEPAPTPAGEFDPAAWLKALAAEKGRLADALARQPNRARAIDEYQDFGYQSINEFLRTGKAVVDDDDGWQDTVSLDAMTNAVRQTMVPIPAPAVLWRGALTSRYVNAKPGDVVGNPAFSSTSTDRKTAADFANGVLDTPKANDERVLLKVLAPAGTLALPFALINRGSESEVLLDRGTGFRILDAPPAGPDGLRVITVEPVSPEPYQPYVPPAPEVPVAAASAGAAIAAAGAAEAVAAMAANPALFTMVKKSHLLKGEDLDRFDAAKDAIGPEQAEKLPDWQKRIVEATQIAPPLAQPVTVYYTERPTIWDDAAAGEEIMVAGERPLYTSLDAAMADSPAPVSVFRVEIAAGTPALPVGDGIYVLPRSLFPKVTDNAPGTSLDVRRVVTMEIAPPAVQALEAPTQDAAEAWRDAFGDAMAARFHAATDGTTDPYRNIDVRDYILWYADIQEMLATDPAAVWGDSDLARRVRHIDAAMDAVRTHADTVVWRGVREARWDSVEVGSTVTLPGFVSTTTDPDVAEEFIRRTAHRGNDPTLLMVRVPKGTPAILMQWTNAEDWTKELLLDRGMTFRVAEVYPATDDSPRVITLDIVPADAVQPLVAEEKDADGLPKGIDKTNVVQVLKHRTADLKKSFEPDPRTWWGKRFTDGDGDRFLDTKNDGVPSVAYPDPADTRTEAERLAALGERNRQLMDEVRKEIPKLDETLASTDFALPDPEFIQRAMSLDHRARFWYETWAEAVLELTDLPPSLRIVLFELMAATSGGTKPEDQPRTMFGALAEEAQRLPSQTPGRNVSDISVALDPSREFTSPKYFQFAITPMALADANLDFPLPTIDARMFEIFGLPSSAASNWRQFEAVARFIVKMTMDQNRAIDAENARRLAAAGLTWNTATDEWKRANLLRFYEPWQVQAMLWVQWRQDRAIVGEDTASDYGPIIQGVIDKLKAGGIMAKGETKITVAHLQHPDIFKVIIPQLQAQRDAAVATVEVAAARPVEQPRPEPGFVGPMQADYIHEQTAGLVADLLTRNDAQSRELVLAYEGIQRRQMQKLAFQYRDEQMLAENADYQRLIAKMARGVLSEDEKAERTRLANRVKTHAKNEKTLIGLEDRLAKGETLSAKERATLERLQSTANERRTDQRRLAELDEKIASGKLTKEEKALLEAAVKEATQPPLLEQLARAIAGVTVALPQIDIKKAFGVFGGAVSPNMRIPNVANFGKDRDIVPGDEYTSGWQPMPKWFQKVFLAYLGKHLHQYSMASTRMADIAEGTPFTAEGEPYHNAYRVFLHDYATAADPERVAQLNARIGHIASSWLANNGTVLDILPIKNDGKLGAVDRAELQAAVDEVFGPSDRTRLIAKFFDSVYIQMDPNDDGTETYNSVIIDFENGVQLPEWKGTTGVSTAVLDTLKPGLVRGYAKDNGLDPAALRADFASYQDWKARQGRDLNTLAARPRGRAGRIDDLRPVESRLNFVVEGYEQELRDWLVIAQSDPGALSPQQKAKLASWARTGRLQRTAETDSGGVEAAAEEAAVQELPAAPPGPVVVDRDPEVWDEETATAVVQKLLPHAGVDLAGLDYSGRGVQGMIDALRETAANQPGALREVKFFGTLKGKGSPKNLKPSAMGYFDPSDGTMYINPETVANDRKDIPVRDGMMWAVKLDAKGAVHHELGHSWHKAVKRNSKAKAQLDLFLAFHPHGYTPLSLYARSSQAEYIAELRAYLAFDPTFKRIAQRVDLTEGQRNELRATLEQFKRISDEIDAILAGDAEPAPAAETAAQMALTAPKSANPASNNSNDGLSGRALMEAKLKPDTLARADVVVDLSEKYDATDEMYSRVDPETGKRVWSAERAALHDRLLDEEEAKWATKPKRRKAIFIGGLPGAGKTSYLTSEAAKRDLGINLDDYVVNNPDEWKGRLWETPGAVPDYPGLKPGETASLIHEESSYLADVEFARLLESGTDIIVDKTMGSPGSTARIMAALEAAGYDVTAVYVESTAAESLARAEYRWRGPKGDFEGRYAYLAGIAKDAATADENGHVINRRNFEEIVKPKASQWALVDHHTLGNPVVVEASYIQPLADPDNPASNNSNDGLSGEALMRAKLRPETVERAAEVARLSEVYDDTTEMFSRVDPEQGKRVWTPERERLHERLLAEDRAEWAGKPRKKQALFVGGLPGAGKSTYLKKYAKDHLGIELADYVTTNPDEFKARLWDTPGAVPEYPGLKPGETASLIHEESSYLADEQFADLIASGANIIVDKTMGSPKSTAKIMKMLADAGYEVDSVYVESTAAESLARAEYRWRGEDGQYNGRYAYLWGIADDAKTVDERGWVINRQNFEEIVKPGSRKWALVDHHTLGEPKVVEASFMEVEALEAPEPDIPYSGGPSNNPDGGLSGDDLMRAKLKPDTYERAKLVMRLSAEHQSTDKLYMAMDPETGKPAWIPERAALHDYLLDQDEASWTAPREFKLIFLGGIPAAGKSTFIEGDDFKELFPDLDPSDFVTTNPDEWKGKLWETEGAVPDYAGLKPMETASLVHEESSYLADLQFERLLASGRNIIVDKTMGSEKSAAKIMKMAEEAGYTVTGIFIDSTASESLARGEYRWRGKDGTFEGRYAYLKGIADDAAKVNEQGWSVNRQAFENVVKPLADRWALVDHHTLGEPVVVESSEDVQALEAPPPTAEEYRDRMPADRRAALESLPYGSAIPLGDYVGPDYNRINRYLRGDPEPQRDPARTEGDIAAIRDLMQANATHEPVVVYRGVRDSTRWLNAKPGDTWTNPAFTSTSFNREAAEQFAGFAANAKYGTEAVLLEIAVPAGTPAVPLYMAKRANWDGRPIGLFSEQELLLDADLTFTVTGVDTDPRTKLKVVRLELVPAAE